MGDGVRQVDSEELRPETTGDLRGSFLVSKGDRRGLEVSKTFQGVSAPSETP